MPSGRTGRGASPVRTPLLAREFLLGKPEGEYITKIHQHVKLRIDEIVTLERVRKGGDRLYKYQYPRAHSFKTFIENLLVIGLLERVREEDGRPVRAHTTLTQRRHLQMASWVRIAPGEENSDRWADPQRYVKERLGYESLDVPYPTLDQETDFLALPRPDRPQPHPPAAGVDRPAPGAAAVPATAPAGGRRRGRPGRRAAPAQPLAERVAGWQTDIDETDWTGSVTKLAERIAVLTPAERGRLSELGDLEGLITEFQALDLPGAASEARMDAFQGIVNRFDEFPVAPGPEPAAEEAAEEGEPEASGRGARKGKRARLPTDKVERLVAQWLRGSETAGNFSFFLSSVTAGINKLDPDDRERLIGLGNLRKLMSEYSHLDDRGRSPEEALRIRQAKRDEVILQGLGKLDVLAAGETAEMLTIGEMLEREEAAAAVASAPVAAPVPPEPPAATPGPVEIVPQDLDAHRRQTLILLRSVAQRDTPHSQDFRGAFDVLQRFLARVEEEIGRELYPEPFAARAAFAGCVERLNNATGTALMGRELTACMAALRLLVETLTERVPEPEEEE